MSCSSLSATAQASGKSSEIHWKYHQFFHEDVISLPRLSMIWASILENKDMYKFSLPVVKTIGKSAGKFFAHAEDMVNLAACLYGASVQSLVTRTWCLFSAAKVLQCDGPVKFKLGFTHDPVKRMCSGYALEGYHRMHLLHIAANSLVCKCLEAHLIRLVKTQQGCQNENPGGEGPDHFEGPYFVYLAIKMLSR